MRIARARGHVLRAAELGAEGGMFTGDRRIQRRRRKAVGTMRKACWWTDCCGFSLAAIVRSGDHLSMRHRIGRLPLLLLLALTAVGCGPAYRIIPSDASDHQPRLRDSAIARVGECVEQYSMQISPGAHRLDFRMEVTQDDKFERRKVIGPEGPSVHLEMQMCMRIALRAAGIPAEVFQSASVTPESRKHLGVAQAAGGIVALGPIIIAAAGVTIGVYVVVVVMEQVENAEKERCKAVKERCIEYCSDAVLDQGFHEPYFSRCLRTCMEKANCW